MKKRGAGVSYAAIAYTFPPFFPSIAPSDNEDGDKRMLYSNPSWRAIR